MDIIQKKLSVLIPAYNEEQTIAQILDKVAGVELPFGIAKEIIVIDDCSVDQTSDRIKAFACSHPGVNLTHIRHKKNRGKGFALRTGIAAATGDIIIIQDADLEYDPEDYAVMLPYIVSGDYNVVYGSRILNKSNTYSYRKFYWGGKFVSLVASILFFTKITDEPTCYKMFDAPLLKSIPLLSDGFGFCPEITAKVLKSGYKIKEVPIRYYPRTIAEGKKIKWHDGLVAIGILFRYRFFYKSEENGKNGDS